MDLKQLSKDELIEYANNIINENNELKQELENMQTIISDLGNIPELFERFHHCLDEVNNYNGDELKVVYKDEYVERLDLFLKEHPLLQSFIDIKEFNE